MPTTDPRATAYALIIVLAAAGGTVPTVMHASRASHQGTAVTAVAQSQPVAADADPANNPWD